MELAEIQTLAKYPFLTESRDYVSSLNLSFEDILKHPIYSSSLDLGKQRILDCIEKKYKPDFSDRLSAELCILSYPVAKMIANLVGRSVSYNWAQGEAETVHKLLKSDDDSVVERLTSDLDLRVSENHMPFLKYTQLSASISRNNPKWKLANRIVDKGIVEVEEWEVKTLLQEAVRNRVLEPIDLSKIPEEIKKVAKNMKGQLTGNAQSLEIESLEEEALPPCIVGITSDLSGGVASHQSMFILATFLHNLGLKKAGILGVLSKSPKYDEEKATYQLEFLTGERGGTEYTCPTCVTIKSHGLCKADCNVKHPLQYYRRHAKRKPKVIKKKGK